MILVVDASVALNWFLHIREEEAEFDRALAILAGVDDGRIQLVQPPHFVAEVASVLVREKPDEAQEDLLDLLNLEYRLLDDPAIYATAVDLSIRCRHHFFDALYHAVALNTPGAMLVTANRRYFDRAKNIGQIIRLADFEFPGDGPEQWARELDSAP